MIDYFLLLALIALIVKDVIPSVVGLYTATRLRADAWDAALSDLWRRR